MGKKEIWSKLFLVFLGRKVEKKVFKKYLTVEALYLDLEDLKQSKSDGEKNLKMERQKVVLPS